MRFDTSVTDRQMFRDWCASYSLGPAETTAEDVDQHLADVPGAVAAQLRRRASAEELRPSRRRSQAGRPPDGVSRRCESALESTFRLDRPSASGTRCAYAVVRISVLANQVR
ncbi:hypothetical protein ABIB54_003436 [Frigoribacterium sp. UYMn621]